MRELLRRAAGLALVVTLGVALPATAVQDRPGPVEVGVFSQPVRFAGGDATTFTVDGDARYGETLEVRPTAGELVLVNDVSMTTYVEGLGEVPFSWPMEALKAQVVAARTYAWFSIQQGSFQRSGYDICATTACQVYRGRDQADELAADRWEQAVAETEGEALVHDGRPILARYFSTSGGQTRDNEEVFPQEGPRPYLKGVEDPDDAVSPLHRWQVEFPRDRFDEILARGQTLSAAVPIADIRYVDPPSGSDRVVVTGRDGRTVEVGASAFRGFVSNVAPELFPDDYPARWPGRDRRYPETLLSSRLTFEVSQDRVVVEGRGWGHGVGMGQYGALGKAERGLTYEEILAAYYNGLRPTTPDDLPRRVRVGVDRTEEPLTLRADAPVRIVVGDRVVTERGLGTWRVEPRPDGTVALLAPPGFGAPLRAAPTASSRAQPFTIERITLEADVNKATEVALEVTTADGADVLRRDLGIADPGTVSARWGLVDAAGAPVEPGEYRARIVATDETGATDGTAVSIRVREPRPAAELRPALDPAPPPPPGPGVPWGLLAVALVAGAAAGAATGTLARPATAAGPA